MEKAKRHLHVEQTGTSEAETTGSTPSRLNRQAPNAGRTV